MRNTWFLAQMEHKPTAKVIFDVGVYRGGTTAGYLECYPDALVYAFEPAREALAEMERQFADSARVKIVPMAVGERSGEVLFHVNSHPATNSILALSAEYEQLAGVRTLETVSVPMVSVDDVCQNEGIDHIDILKVDTQGYDYQVLLGARAMLASWAVDLVVVEMCWRSFYDAQATKGEIEGLLRPLGYQGPETLHSHGDQYGDYLFVRRQ